MLRILLSIGFAWRLLCGACPAAGPTREEVKAWTKQYEAGMAAWKQLNTSEAFQLFMGALKIADGFGPKDIRLADNLAACGKLLVIFDQSAAAEPFLRRAAAVRETARGDSHRETAWAWLDHAEVLTELDKLAEAEALIQRAKRNLEKAFGPYHTTVGSCLAAQAKVKARQKHFTEAEELYKSALRFFGRSGTTLRKGIDGFVLLDMTMNKMIVARTQNDLAELYVAAGRYADAVAAFREAIKLVESKEGKQARAIPATLIELAKAQMKQADFAGASATLEQAIQLAVKIYGSERPTTIIARFARVNLLIAQEKWKEAEAEGAVAMAGAASVLEAMSPEWIPLVETLIIISEKQGDADSIKRHRARIAEIRQFHAKRFSLPEK